MPWWVAALIIGRDVAAGRDPAGAAALRLTALPVHYLGKAATFA